eukprot:454003-Pleurochrysis_carterae.AAC.1
MKKKKREQQEEEEEEKEEEYKKTLPEAQAAFLPKLLGSVVGAKQEKRGRAGVIGLCEHVANKSCCHRSLLLRRAHATVRYMHY